MISNFPFLDVIKYMPVNLKSILMNVPIEIMKEMEEIRLRLNKPLIISGSTKEYFISTKGLTTEISNAYLITPEDISNAVQLISNFSLYSVEDEVKNGFVTISGGHRIGIAGKVVTENSKIRTIKNITFINYRIAKEILGASDKIINHIIRAPNYVFNTLIISPPQCGKTTLLRDIIRQISNGISGSNFSGRKVSLVDERSEIAACALGHPRNDIGMRTDVLDGCPKAEGIIMMVRSMSPDVIATDEIGRDEDGKAILDAVNAGVKIITTIHGNSIEDFLKKTTLKPLHNNVFERIIVLSRRLGVGTVEKIVNGEFQSIINSYELRGMK